MIKLQFTLSLIIEAESGHLEHSDIDATADSLISAVQNRIFGEGFSPDNVLIENWDIKRESNQC